jgi:predicted dienelactone hydrolase
LEFLHIFEAAEGVDMKIIVIACVLILAAGSCTSEGVRLPAPSGPYEVGTTHLVFVDKSRPEVFTDEPDDTREVTVRAWYPAGAEAEAAIAPYYEDADAMVQNFSYPPELAEVETNSMLDVPVSEEEDDYPVILFNHGWGEHAVQNTVLMEELASRGYAVFSLAHHYEAKYWAYPDGRIEYLSLASTRFQHLMAEQNNPGIMHLFQAMFTTTDADSQAALFRRTVEAMPTFLGEGPRMWAEDIAFIVGELDSLNGGDGRFAGKLDLERLGVMGMSLGGAAAGQACIGDSRIRAAMNVDGGLLGDLVDSVLTTPVMFVGSRRFIGYDEVFARHASGDAYTLTIGDADHYDFTDFTLLHRDHPMIGTVDGRQMLDIMNAYTLAFFDFYLKGIESELLTGESRPYPEAQLRVHTAP